MWYSMVVRIACNSSGDGFAGSTKRGTKSPAAFTLARALGRYRLPRKGVDRVANKVDLPTFDAIQPLRPRWAGRAAWVTHGDGRTPGERAQGIHVAHDAHHAQHLAAKQVGQQEQLPAGQEFLMAPRRLLARRGQVEKLLTLHGVLGLFGELSIFLRFAAKVVDVLHAMVSHLSGARVATQPTRRSMTRKHESCTSGLMQI